MEDMDGNSLSTGFGPLFIREEAKDSDREVAVQRERSTAQPGLTFSETSALIKPYLQEMDELLQSCEDLTGIPFGASFSESSTETCLSNSGEEVTTQSYRETSVSPQAYLSTSYLDSHMDVSGAEDLPSTGTLPSRCGLSTGVPRQPVMPVSSAGSKLSEAMVEYEGQLLGMLAMLEGCMEETGMDFEPQGWATDVSQEYVHISKTGNRGRDTTLGPVQQETPVKMETQPRQSVPGAAQHAERGYVSKENSTNGAAAGPVANRCQQNPVLCCDNTGGVSMENLERSEKRDQGVLDPQVSYFGPLEPLDSNENDPMYCEGTQTRFMFNEGSETNTTGTEARDTEMQAERRGELKMNTRSGMNELDELGSQMEECIQEVEQLEKKRKELLVEVLELRGNKNREEAEEEEEWTEERINSQVDELMHILKREEEERRGERKKELQGLREERAEEERRLWRTDLERLGLQEELRRLRRKLFAAVRDCTHGQSSLNNQRREVELLKREEEKLQALVLQLTEEKSRLRSAQQQQLSHLRAEHQARTSSPSANSQEELIECKRHSCGDIQQYLQGGLKALEDRYEPVLLALLKRREATAAALVTAKGQAQELRAQLRPLREQIQKLQLQRACLEEKLKLIHIHRREDLGQYKETVYFLEETGRELKMELQIQKKKTRDTEELRDNLAKELLLYRAAIKDHEEQT